MRTSTLVAGIAAAVLLAGCGGAPIPEGSPMPEQTPRPPFQTTSPEMSPSGTPASDVPEAHWSAIRQLLSDEGVDTSDLSLVSAERVTWRNGALGCPAPGQVYTDALEDGMRVVVRASGDEYDIRFGRSGMPMLCKQGLR